MAKKAKNHVPDWKLREKASKKEGPKTFDEALADYDATIVFYKNLIKAASGNVMYRNIDQKQNKTGIASALRAKGNIKRLQIAELENNAFDAGGYAADDREFEASLITEATAFFDSAQKLYDEIEDTAGQAQVHICRAQLLYAAKKKRESMKHYKRAIVSYEEAGDDDMMHAVEERLEYVEKEVNRSELRSKKNKELTSDKVKKAEEDAVRAAFEKFDEDNSGSIDVHELGSLAKELGTYPELTKAELDEAISQLDSSLDGQVTFDEFWQWWNSEELDKAAAVVGGSNLTNL